MEKNNLTNEEIARVFAMYLGCEIMMEAEPESSEPNLDILQAVNLSGAFWTWEQDNSEGQGLEFGKLLLTPLSNISDVHAMLVANICYPDDFKNNTSEYIIRWGKFYAQEGKYIWKLYNQLVLWGYAVPLWFGVDHLENGKTAIELSLAIDATTLKQKL